jgi:hypothetical protein
MREGVHVFFFCSSMDFNKPAFLFLDEFGQREPTAAWDHLLLFLLESLPALWAQEIWTTFRGHGFRRSIDDTN